MKLTDQILSLGHEKILVNSNEDLGYISIIAIHNTALGPALGGCRFKPYTSFDSALNDALRLSSAMTYKNALCGNSFGGGKSVIIQLKESYSKDERKKLFYSFAEKINSVNGSYITAEDMGTGEADMRAMYEKTKWVCGKPEDLNGGGDPSPYTALGVFSGIKACLKHVYGSDELSGKTIGIEGVGSVGYYLAELIYKSGGELIVTDIDKAKAELAHREFGARVVGSNEIYAQPMDAFAPCAIGATINEETIRQLQTKIIAGGANNQLSSTQIGKELFERGIVYAPDFVINSGGVISCAGELAEGGHNPEDVKAKARDIYKVIDKILEKSKKSNTATNEIAIDLAKQIIQSKKSNI